MRGVIRPLVAIGLAGALLGGTASLSQAAPVDRERYEEDFVGSETFSAEDAPAGCVDYAGTFTEVRSGHFDLMAPGTGVRSDEVKVHGAIRGWVSFVPDDPADAVTYEGTYTNA